MCFNVCVSHHDERQHRQDVVGGISKKRPPRQKHRLWRKVTELHRIKSLHTGRDNPVIQNNTGRKMGKKNQKHILSLWFLQQSDKWKNIKQDQRIKLVNEILFCPLLAPKQEGC